MATLDKEKPQEPSPHNFSQASWLSEVHEEYTRYRLEDVKVSLPAPPVIAPNRALVPEAQGNEIGLVDGAQSTEEEDRPENALDKSYRIT